MNMFVQLLTACWSPTWESCAADFHRIERRVVRLWRDWNETTLFVVCV